MENGNEKDDRNRLDRMLIFRRCRTNNTIRINISADFLTFEAFPSESHLANENVVILIFNISGLIIRGNLSHCPL